MAETVEQKRRASYNGRLMKTTITTPISFVASQILALTAAAWNIAPQNSAFIFADVPRAYHESIAA